MTDRQLALGVMLASSADEQAPQWLVQLVEDGLAGVTLFGPNLASATHTRAFVADLAAARADVIVAIDEEGGDVTRLDAALGGSIPGNAALGSADDVDLTASAASFTASRLRGLGINLNFAPVADVNVEASNPVIGVRSYSRDAAIVARHVAAAVSGTQTHVAACAKHFPGHGATVTDSHHTLPVIQSSVDELRSVEFPPFVAAIDAGVDAIMLAHLLVPALADIPSSQSAAIVDLLRDDLGFDGVIVSDALDMAAVGSPDDLGPAAEASLLAGVDLLCLGANLTEDQTRRVVDHVVEAVDSGRLDRESLQTSHDRLAAMVEQRHGAVADVHEQDRRRIAHTIADRAINVTGDMQSFGPITLIECRPPQSPAGADLHVDFGAHLPDDVPVSVVRYVDAEAGLGSLADVGCGPSSDVVVVVRSLDVHPWQRRTVEYFLAVGARVAVVELGWPSATPVGAHLTIETFDASAASCRAAAQALISNFNVQ